MSFFGIPESVIAACSTGDSISVSLCSSSRATADWTNETTATSRIRKSLPASEVVLVTVVFLVGLAGRLPPQQRRVIGLELVGPLGLHPHAHVHLVHLGAADQPEHYVVRTVEQDLRRHVRDLGCELR